ncbi:MAG: hypothetical protein EP343_08255 [Deltaproteobacteria bacterium]|nr:MAG: hypothetical protein EP343_08255 [Deltaproteobacteria bacterium]
MKKLSIAIVMVCGLGILTACGGPHPALDNPNNSASFQQKQSSLATSPQPSIPKHLWGVWEGRAKHVGGNANFDHDTHINIVSSTRALARYTYVLNGSTFVCESELKLQHSVGITYFFKDTSLTPGCVDGLVRLKKPEANYLNFLWRDSSGSTLDDTAGRLTRP